MQTKTPLVLGNWKMNPLTVAQATSLTTEIKKKLKTTHAEVVVAPPMVYMSAVHKAKGAATSFALGAQNVHFDKIGARTGEISIPMLAGNFGVTHYILGHSERRVLGETDALIAQKLAAVLKAGHTGVVCVGERTRDHSADYLSFVEAQVKSVCKEVQKAKLSKFVIAYEPIWAIGTGVHATASDVHEMKLFIEKILSDLYGRSAAQKVRILYGGSVDAKNARELYTGGTVHGFLVGGASLHADDFVQIVKATV